MTEIQPTISRTAWGKWLAGLVAGGALVGVLLWPHPDQVTLQWNAVPRAAGYHVHHGRAPRTYDEVRDARTATTYTWKALTQGRHYFSVTAYNAQRIDGAHGEELTTTIP